ncbi:MAG: T9SS type A sorting domain-containing protein [Bacteroidota bacterium]
MKSFLSFFSFLLGSTFLFSQALDFIKVGEASNGFSSLNPYMHTLSASPDIGNQGGAIAFIYRQNIANCGGSGNASGWYRYSISNDGGTSWNVGAGINNSATPPVAGCYGLGVLNPIYSQISRYPNIALASPEQASDSAMRLVYCGPVLSPSGGGWDGAVYGMADMVSTTPQVSQEIYPFSGGGNQYFSFSLVERVPGEFWTAAFSVDGSDIGGNVHLNRGIYNSTTNQINWSVATTLTPIYSQAISSAPQRIPGLKIAFSPDGMTGYVGMLADLAGKQDSVFSPCLAKTTDGGLNWGPLLEIDLRMFHSVGLLDSLAGPLQSTGDGNMVPAGGKVPTAWSSFDLSVDQYGHPHLFCLIGNASIHTGNGTYSDPQYTFYPVLPMFGYDLTIDTFGDWNLLQVERQLTSSGEFGLPGGNSSELVNIPAFLRLSRSKEGNLLFYSWNDTDTTGGSNNGNNQPNLFGKGLDIDKWTMTPTQSWTQGDPIWDDLAIMPQVSPLAVQLDSCTYGVPTVLADLGPPGTSFLTMTSYFYLPAITYDTCSQFTEEPIFFQNCAENPFTNSLFQLEPTCGSSDGKLWVVPAGGIPPYTYQWSTGSATDTISNLSAGKYSLILTDSVNCTDTISTTLSNLNAPSVSISSISDVSCSGAADGSISLSVSGGTLPYSFTWSSGEISQDVSGIGGGLYEVVITDASGCQNFASASVHEPFPLTLTGNIMDALCAGESTGSIDIQVSGGTPTYSFLWSSGQTTEDISNLAPNTTYTVNITDLNNCSVSNSFTPSAPDPIHSNVLAFFNSQCAPNETGSAITTTSGGTAPYQYNWSGPGGYSSMGNFIFGLPAGLYSVEVTDANGCMVDTFALITSLNVINVTSSVTDAFCNNSMDGSISITPTNGTPPYTYLWSDGSTQASLTGANPGVYHCQILDAAGCSQAIIDTIESLTSFGVSALISPPSCQGAEDGSIFLQGLASNYTIQWSNLTGDSLLAGIGAGSYSVVISDTNGCSEMFTYQLSEPDALDIDFVQGAPISCFGDSTGVLASQISGGTFPYSYSWSTGDTSSVIAGLAAGIYGLMITDMNGCTLIDSSQIQEPDSLEIEAVTTDPICLGDSNGTTAILVRGGTNPYRIFRSISSGSQLFASSVWFSTSLAQGSYSALIQDANGCEDSIYFGLTDPPLLSMQVSSSPDNGSTNGRASVTPDGGRPPYSYQWSTGAQDSAITGLAMGGYLVQITDSSGCVLADSIFVDSNVGIDQGLYSGIQHMKLYPNPTNQQFFVEVDLHQPGQLEVNLYDMTGRLVHQRTSLQALQFHLIPVNRLHLSNGTYLVEIKTDIGSVYEKLVFLD